MEWSPQKIIAYSIAGACILLPIILIFFNPAAGALALFMGALIASRVIRYAHQVDPLMSAETRARLARHQSDQSQTIFVQVVDDRGYDLPQHEVKRRMEEAQLRAGPRDTVIAVRHKVK
jgi:hypothetical protein